MKRIIFPTSILFYSILFYGSLGAVENSPINLQEKTKSNEETTPFSFLLEPGINIPLGKDAEYLKTAGNINISGEYILPSFQNILPSFLNFYLTCGIGYSSSSVKNLSSNNEDIKNPSFSIFSAMAGAGTNFNIMPKFGLKLFISSGFYYGFLNDGSRFVGGGNPLLLFGGRFYFLPSKRFELFLNSAYKNYFGLYNGIDVSLGAGLSFSIRKKPGDVEGLKITDIEFENVFPVFHKYYDDHPVGKATLNNSGEFLLTDIKINLLVKEYMDAPKECAEIPKLKPGESTEIDLYALFARRILEITEATKAAAEISVKYKLNGKSYSDTRVETLRIHDRNAMIWDDDRKAAAFVTAKDPLLLTFSKNIMGMVKGKRGQVVNTNVRLAMAFHESLSVYGMTYSVDPKTPYTEFSKKRTEIDFLQFPRQTLQYKAGDCDDLSILYAAFMESVGIETAFITIPGHIFMAFSTDMDPETARTSFSIPDNLIIMNGKTWIPVEVTEIDGGFLKAWEKGAKQWREHFTKGQVSFYPVHESWHLYEPVGFSETVTNIALPEGNEVLRAYLEELEAFIGREISPKITEINSEIRRNGETPYLINKLGVLYAKYGLLDKAEKEFNKIFRNQEYVPALVNMGNIYYLRENWKKALEYYNLAYEKDPSDKRILLCLARVHNELENYGIAREIYDKLKEIDPELALKFSYLGLRTEEALKSEEIGKLKETILWEE